MNIFFIDKDPVIAAQLLCNSHCIKMILESCQLLSTAHRLLDGEPYIALSKTGRKVKRWRLPDSREDVLYPATHVHHPSTVWARSGAENYRWLYDHLHAMVHEYGYRYGKLHKCNDLLLPLFNVPVNIQRVPFTQPPPAMDKQYIVSDDSVENYRNYYRLAKKHLHSWKNRPVPDWIY